MTSIAWIIIGIIFAMAALCALNGCADFGHYVSAMDLQAGVSSDPYNSNSTRVTMGGKIYFRDPTAKRLPNYSKDK